MAKHYDRAAEDLGNITMLEHVNLQIPDQAQGTLFYITGLGLTRDPYMNTGLANMWINVGKSQFHLPTGDPWVLRGAIGLVTPDRQALLKRLDGDKKQLAGTKFAVVENNDYVAVTCPWGNRFNMHSPDAERFGAINLGMPYLEFDVPKKTATARSLVRRPGSRATAAAGLRISTSATSRHWCSVKPPGGSRPMTDTISRSMSRISPVRTRR